MTFSTMGAPSITLSTFFTAWHRHAVDRFRA